MNISKENITIIIVTFKSEEVIYDCLKTIPKDISIIIVDNSNDKKFKSNIEKKFNNIKCVLSEQNLGMGAGNNYGLKYVKTDFAFLINPDVTFDNDAFDELINSIKILKTFGIVSPLSKNTNRPNYRLDEHQNIDYDKNKPFKVKSVDGYAMLINLKKLNDSEKFKNLNYFDEKIFMYLENDDLCKRVKEINEDIYVIPNSKINHLGGSAVSKIYEYEIEMSRNWHWIWSKYYFNKKHFGTITAIKNGIPSFCSALFKFLFYLFINKRKKDIYFHRMSGFINAMIGRSSYFRPKIF